VLIDDASGDGARFCVRRDDLRQWRWRREPRPRAAELAPAEAVIAISRFAFTANNVTYARFGDALHYWRFFPVPEPGWGQIPVWGLGTVALSRQPSLPEGERVYGYFPMATHLVVAPGRLRPASFVDAQPHRADLPATYNEYRLVDRDPHHDRLNEDEHLVLRPLFSLWFFLAEFLKEAAFFGAKAILIASASSKAALGLAFLLRESGSGGPALIGLTARGNLAFVERHGRYDRVLAYDAIDGLAGDVAAVFVDIAGDARIRAAIHRKLGASLSYSCRVGATHGPDEDVAAALPGPRPEWFFTPTHILARRREWGAERLRGRLAAAWGPYVENAKAWLRIEAAPGAAAVERVYRDVLEGRSDPARAVILTVDGAAAGRA
jgi:hypothetical protein